MQEYKRNPQCECAKYRNREEMSLQERLASSTFWQTGIIYENGTARECKCHKTFRLLGRYDRIAKTVGLPSYKELQNLKYLGEGDSYQKLKALPKIIANKKLKDVLCYVYGNNNCQKTTSLAKVLVEIIENEMTVTYINFSELIEKLASNSTGNSENLAELINSDWLIIDDCFEGETINFKTVYNQFFNLILKRKSPTILATVYSRDALLKAKNIPSFIPEMLEKLFNKIDKYNTEIEFTNNVDKILLGNKKIDLWNLD